MAEQNGFPLVPLGEVAVPIERSEEPLCLRRQHHQ
jgi:hypothetical protein